MVGDVMWVDDEGEERERKKCFRQRLNMNVLAAPSSNARGALAGRAAKEEGPPAHPQHVQSEAPGDHEAAHVTSSGVAAARLLTNGLCTAATRDQTRLDNLALHHAIHLHLWR